MAARDETGGMAGRDWAEEEEPKLTRMERIDLTVHDGSGKGTYLGAVGGNFGQFYVASMLENRMLAPSKGVPVIGEELGRPLAHAFRQATGDVADLAAEAIIGGSVSVADLEPIGAAMGPQAIMHGSSELALLMAFLAGTDGDAKGAARRSSACLLLEYLRLLGGNEYRERDVREAFYNRVMPDGSPYPVTGLPLDLWRAYQANELCHAAFAALFNGMMRASQANPDGTRPGDLARAFAGDTAAAAAGTRPWRDWADDSGAECSGDEESLAATLACCLTRERSADTGGHVAALRLLSTLWARWAAGQERVLPLIRRFTGPGGRSMWSVMETLNLHANRSVPDALAAVLQRHGITDHLAIAARKLLSGGRDTYHFTVADGLLTDGVSRPFDYTAPRLTNLARFLGDAHLHKGHRVTKAGLELLRAHDGG